MKVEKTLAVLMAILPLVYLAVIALFLLTELDNALYTALSFLVLLGLILAICFATLTKGTNRKFLATANVWMLSTNAAVFLAEIIWYAVSYRDVYIEERNGAMGGGLLLFLILLICTPHWLTYLFTRVCAAINCYRVTKEVNADRSTILHIFAHLIPIVDLFSAIFVLRKVKPCQVCQQPTIDTHK